MATIIVLLPLLAMVAMAYYDWHSSRMQPPAAITDPPPEEPATPAEAREAVLAHQLVDGAVDASVYRALMEQLAHSGAQAGGPR